MRIPQGSPQPLNRDEVAHLTGRLLGRLEERINGGVDKYGGSYMLANLKEDLIEELLDASAYFLLMVARVESVLPEFEGLTSNEIVAGR